MPISLNTNASLYPSSNHMGDTLDDGLSEIISNSDSDSDFKPIIKELNDQLFQAIADNDAKTLRELLKKDLSFEYCEGLESAPLHAAINSGKIELVRAFTEFPHFTSHDYPEYSAQNPLIFAAEKFFLDAVMLLAPTSHENEYALHALDIILAKSSENPDLRDEHYRDCIYTLIKNIQDEEHSANTLKIAIDTNCQTSVRLLLQTRSPIYNSKEFKEERTALTYAVLQENTGVVRELLNSNFPVNSMDKYGKTALMYAIENKNIEITHLLISTNTDIHIKNAYGVSAYDLGIQINPISTKTITIIQNAIAHVDICQKYFDAIEKKDINKIYWLHKSGPARFLGRNAEGDTLVHAAVKSGDSRILDELLKDNQSVAKFKTSYFETHNAEKMTPLHLSASLGMTEMVKTLRKFGANFNTLGNNFNSPLSCAIRGMHNETIKVLLLNGAHPDAYQGLALRAANTTDLRTESR